jgi:hypothetical protein
MNTVTLERNVLRPSTLDKLARCNWFKSTPPGPPAERGTKVDELLRQFFCNETPFIPEELQKPFAYGAQQTVRIAGEYRAAIVADKRQCVVRVPGFPQPAECDCAIAPLFISVDWKTGGKWDYTRQQAAYALGQMAYEFAPHWTCVVVFVDREETEWHRFSLGEAREIVEASIQSYAQPQPPTINEFCGFCANFNICPAQREAAGYALAVSDSSLNFELVKEDPERLGQFLAGCQALKKYDEEAREAARDWIVKGHKVPYFTLSNGRRSHFVEPATVLFACKEAELPVDALETAVMLSGPISKDQYEKLCTAIGRTPDPGEIKTQQGEPFIRFTGKKNQHPLKD